MDLIFFIVSYIISMCNCYEEGEFLKTMFGNGDFADREMVSIEFFVIKNDEKLYEFIKIRVDIYLFTLATSARQRCAFSQFLRIFSKQT